MWALKGKLRGVQKGKESGGCLGIKQKHTKTWFVSLVLRTSGDLLSLGPCSLVPFGEYVFIFSWVLKQIQIFKQVV